nr:extracellular matrix/biofilm biosynthesis regulator RemA family protein [Planomicrobium sp. CPCC 101110]
MAVVQAEKAVKFISIGGSSAVSANRIVSNVTPDSAPAKRLI